MQVGPQAVVSRVLRHHSKHKYKWNNALNKINIYIYMSTKTIYIYTKTIYIYIVLQNPNLYDMILDHICDIYLIYQYNLFNINVPKAYTYTNNVKKTMLNTTNQDLKLSLNIHLVSGFTKLWGSKRIVIAREPRNNHHGNLRATPSMPPSPRNKVFFKGLHYLKLR